MSSPLSLELHPFQQVAIANIRSQAIALRPEALSILSQVFRMSNLPIERLENAHRCIRQYARVALHFHPDRPTSNGRSVAESLLEDGLCKSQFETGISNGLVATQLGGQRDNWERNLFHGAYHNDIASAHGFEPKLRPKYGALDLMRNSDGPAPRFGSYNPKYRGTINEFDAILAALLEECFTRDFALGVSNIRPPQLMEYLETLSASPRRANRTGTPSRNLDHMIEAQIHGDISLVREVEALVADPSFFSRGNTGQVLKAMCEKYGFPLRLSHGFRMRVDNVPSDFRGPTMASLAARIAIDRYVDAEVIGSAVRDLAEDPERWKDRGSFADVLQELKLLWHVLVRYGETVD